MQYDYIRSLDLETVLSTTSTVLNQSLAAIAEFYGTQPSLAVDIDKQMLLTQSKRALAKFNIEFGSIVKHVVDMAGFLRAKEEAYLGHIECLTDQTNTLLKENLQLTSKL